MRRGKRTDQPKTGISFYKGTILVLGLVLAVILFLAAAKEPQFASTINTKVPEAEETEPETLFEDPAEVRSLTGAAFLEKLVVGEPKEMTEENDEMPEEESEELEDETYIIDSQDLYENEPVAGEEPDSSSSSQPVYKRPADAASQTRRWKRPQQTETKKPAAKPKTSNESQVDSTKVDSAEPDFDSAEVDTTPPQKDTTIPVEEPSDKEPEQPKEPEQTEEDKPVETPVPVTPVEPDPEQPPASPDEPESPQLDTTMPAVDSSEQ